MLERFSGLRFLSTASLLLPSLGPRKFLTVVQVRDVERRVRSLPQKDTVAACWPQQNWKNTCDQNCLRAFETNSFVRFPLRVGLLIYKLKITKPRDRKGLPFLGPSKVFLVTSNL